MISNTPGICSRLRHALTLLALVLSLLSGTPVSAAETDQFKTPALSAHSVDWRAVLARLYTEISDTPAAKHFSFASRHGVRPHDPRAMPALVQLNALTAERFPGIRQSAVPVLLPFDVAGFAADRQRGAPAGDPAARYQAGFETVMFDAGPAGFDAVFALPRDGIDGLKRRVYARAVEVHITGSRLTYAIVDPLAGTGTPVPALAADYPDLRRVIREGFVRYAFTRFGVPYVVSIHCLDSVPRARRLACREASAIAERFLGALRVTGGEPTRPHADIAAVAVARPAAEHPEFTYRPPGDIIAGSGYRHQPGHSDPTVYAQIRFPLADAPAYANSQSFLNWGDCFQRGRVPRPRTKDAPYRCAGSAKALVFNEAAGENYTYPWRDNFCEARDFGVGQCQSGRGHQGQDIRPSDCTFRNEGADRCIPGRYGVVAVRDGVLIRSRGQQGATLLVNTGGEHFRVRYMHMNPTAMDADSVLSGRRVAEGEQLGRVSNYQDHPGGTTTHLHFDVQVFTRDGWLWVNPYVTLIAAYERLLGKRGLPYPGAAELSEVTPRTLQPSPPAAGNDADGRSIEKFSRQH